MDDRLYSTGDQSMSLLLLWEVSADCGVNRDCWKSGEAVVGDVGVVIIESGWGVGFDSFSPGGGDEEEEDGGSTTEEDELGYCRDVPDQLCAWIRFQDAELAAVMSLATLELRMGRGRE